MDGAPGLPRRRTGAKGDGQNARARPLYAICALPDGWRGDSLALRLIAPGGTIAMKDRAFLSLRSLGAALLLAGGVLTLPGLACAAGQDAPRAATTTPAKTKTIGIVLFPGFETLDVFGPVEMWSRLPDYRIVMVSQHGGPVTSGQGIDTVTTTSFDTAPQFDILMIPGGGGTRAEVNNPAMLAFLRKEDKGTTWTTSVCTGSAVLARAGILDGHKATSNKLAFAWASSQSARVAWQGHARWVVDGKYITSSGVSAGTDMALALVEKLYGHEAAEHMAHFTEYVWNDDPAKDPFAVETQH
jgi:putative intracellular protease/amidase